MGEYVVESVKCRQCQVEATSGSDLDNGGVYCPECDNHVTFEELHDMIIEQQNVLIVNKARSEWRRAMRDMAKNLNNRTSSSGKTGGFGITVSHTYSESPDPPDPQWAFIVEFRKNSQRSGTG